MDIEYDHNKDAFNILKHGVSLADAAVIDWSTLRTGENLRFNYGEVRITGIGFIGERLYCVIYTTRGERRRIISLRKANKREVKTYVLNY